MTTDGRPAPQVAGSGWTPSAEPRDADPVPDAWELTERMIRTAVGLASLAVAFAAAAVAGSARRTGDDPASADDELVGQAFLATAVGATLGFAVEAVQTGARMGADAGRALGPWMSFATSAPLFRRGVWGWMTRMDAVWRAEQRDDEASADAFVRAAVPSIARGVLERLDLTDLVLDSIELDRIVEAVDIELVLSRLDLDEIASRLDVGAIVERVDLDATVKRVDIQAVVDRLDLAAIANEVIAQLDMGAVANGVIDQLDLAAISLRVIEEIDLPEIIRRSSGTMATETVDGIRLQGANADQAVSRFVDRMLRRGDAPGPPADEGDASSDHPLER